MTTGKEVTLSGKEIMNVWNVMQKLATLEVAAKTAYTIHWNANQIYSQWRIIELKRSELIKKYGAPDESGNHIMVTPENQEPFQKEYLEILAKEYTFAIREIEISKLNPPDGILEYMKLLAEKIAELNKEISTDENIVILAELKKELFAAEEKTTFTAQQMNVIEWMIIDDKLLVSLEPQIIMH